LESFTPQKLIQVLRHGISGSLNLESDDSSIILIGDSGNDIYMVESFG
jgi:hydroxymethylpyrimidine pyrophosphatase-like HAD family hydrolase